MLQKWTCLLTNLGYIPRQLRITCTCVHTIPILKKQALAKQIFKYLAKFFLARRKWFSSKCRNFKQGTKGLF